MGPFELSNHQRKYFGLNPVEEGFEKLFITEELALYYKENTIIKVLDYSYGYREYDIEIKTIERKIILPQTTRGKEQKLTAPRILKIKGKGIHFSGSFLGGGVIVYDNRRNTIFIQSFPEEGQIKNLEDIQNWIANYIKTSPPDYFEWLNEQLTLPRQRIVAKEGDIIAYPVSRNKYGFARILIDLYKRYGKKVFYMPDLFGFHPRSFVILPYAYISDNIKLDLDFLIQQKRLPVSCVFDLGVYRGEYPVIGFRELTNEESEIPLPEKKSTAFSINYSKEEILKKMNT